MLNTKDIKYFNRDFTGLKDLLVDFTKTYYPNTYNDFSPSSPGMMVLEMSAYVGDVLSFYLDNQIQETFVQHARQTESIFNLAYMLGYRPKVTKTSTVEVDLYQQLPAKLSGGTYIPDYDYALFLQGNTVVQSNPGGVNFLIQDTVDFTVSSSLDPTEVTIYQTSGGNPQYYLLKKKRKALSSTIQTQTATFTTPTSFDTVNIADTNIIKILDITDSDGNTWYEVPYLGQELIYKSTKNTNTNDPNSYTDTDAQYLLKLEKIARRFTTRFKADNSLEIQFGSGTTSDVDEEILPNGDNVGIGLPFEQIKLTTAFDPSNFLQTDTYGIAPANTTLSIRYLTGGGVSSNVEANTVTTISSTGNIAFQNSNLNSVTSNYIFSSVTVNNELAASGGGDGDTLEEIRQNTLVGFQSQLRNVTTKDYTIRALSMPSDYGAIAKSYVEATKASDNTLPGEIPSTLNLYVLGFDSAKHLITSSNTVKQNLSTYLSEYRIIGDTVKIKDGFIVNIAVDFEIIVFPNFNNNEVLSRCITEIQNYFAIDNWTFNQPILLKELFIRLDKINGVQTVKDIYITNKTGVAQGYSEYAYDIEGATLNNVVYPSLDPCVFEVKYPDTDIRGRVVSL
jgi:hypothetical protein